MALLEIRARGEDPTELRHDAAPVRGRAKDAGKMASVGRSLVTLEVRFANQHADVIQDVRHGGGIPVPRRGPAPNHCDLHHLIAIAVT